MLSIIALQNDVAKKHLWRSTSSLALNTSSTNSRHRKRKGAIFSTPSLKQSYGSSGNFSNNDNKGFF